MDFIETIPNAIQWFFEFIGNICSTFYNLLNYTLDLSVVGLGQVKVIYLLLGGSLLALIIAKIIQWITPVV